MSGAHDWRYDGLSPHNGEYWYKCAVCGATDWIASYGTTDQLMPVNCAGPGPDLKGHVAAVVIFDEPTPLRDGDTISFNQTFRADGTVTTTKPVVKRAEPDETLRLGFGYAGPANARHAVRVASAEPCDYRPVRLLSERSK